MEIRSLGGVGAMVYATVIIIRYIGFDIHVQISASLQQQGLIVLSLMHVFYNKHTEA